MEPKPRHKIVDAILAKLSSDLHSIAEEAPEHWQWEEYVWLAAHRAQAMTRSDSGLGLRRKSFNHTIRAKSW